jgi:hypothetical protein
MKEDLNLLSSVFKNNGNGMKGWMFSVFSFSSLHSKMYNSFEHQKALGNIAKVVLIFPLFKMF